MSNDPKHKPLDPAPDETPDILQRDLNLDRRRTRGPAPEALGTNVAVTQPGMPGPFAQPQPQPMPTPGLGTAAPGQSSRPPNHFELAATAQTPRHPQPPPPRPMVTAQPAQSAPPPQVTRAPVNQAPVPPGLQPKAPGARPPAAPLQPARPPTHAAPGHAPAPAPGTRPPAAPAARPPAPAVPRAPVAPPAPRAPAVAGPQPSTSAHEEVTRAGVAHRPQPPSPAEWAARHGGDAPTIPVPPLPAVKVTVASPMQGATAPSGHHSKASRAPAHVPVANAPPTREPEFPTAPDRRAVPRPAPQPSFSELPQSMPSHLVVTQPGFPSPIPVKREPPVAATKQSMAEPPPAGPTRVLEAHAPVPAPSVTAPQPPVRGGPDFGELPVFDAAGPAEAVESENDVDAVAGDVVAAPASLWRRTFAWLLDLLLISLIVGGFFAAALAVIGKPSLALLVTVAAPAAGVVGFVAFVYTTLFAFLWSGRTPGRRLLGIRLVDSTGQAPRAGRALVRAALSLASFALCLSGFWLALFDRRGQTLHDKLTSTFVVRLKPAI